MVHGDDYFCTGPAEALEKLRSKLAKSFEIKSSMLGAEKRHGDRRDKSEQIWCGLERADGRWKQTRGMLS